MNSFGWFDQVINQNDNTQTCENISYNLLVTEHSKADNYHD